MTARSILGASGLVKPNAPKPPEEEKPAEIRNTEAAHHPLDHTGSETPRAAATVPAPTKEEAPPPSRPAPRPTRTKAAASPQTVYLAPENKRTAKQIAQAIDASERLSGIAQGHIGVSLVVNLALDMLGQEFRRDRNAILDRAVYLASKK